MGENLPLADVEPCRWCGDEHGKLCPYVKALNFDPTTRVITRVEFLTPADYGKAVAELPPETEYPRLATKV